jgi:hypothetical protein
LVERTHRNIRVHYITGKGTKIREGEREREREERERERERKGGGGGGERGKGRERRERERGEEVVSLSPLCYDKRLYRIR